jgi:hypothetical protein
VIAIQSEISDIIEALKKAKIDEAAKQQAVALGQEAQASPTRELVERFWNRLRNFSTVVSIAAGAAKLGSLAGLLPP